MTDLDMAKLKGDKQTMTVLGIAKLRNDRQTMSDCQTGGRQTNDDRSWYGPTARLQAKDNVFAVS